MTLLLAVIDAGSALDEAAIRRLAESGMSGVLLGSPGTRNLLDRHDAAALAEFAAMVRSHGMMTGFAGAFEPPDIPRLRLLDADILAFPVDAPTLEAVRAQMPAEPARAQTGSATADNGVVTRPGAAARQDMDRIFVRDFVLPVRIGTYGRERDKPQNVRFNVDVRIARPRRVPEDMRDVFSYDVISDQIRMIVAQGHIPLVETLAEKIAAAVLAHPRAAHVMVRVEKLETGSGNVGVEIARERDLAG